MPAEWHTLTARTLFLAEQLMHMASRQSQAAEREACLQGAIELALRGRQLLLTLVARYYQQTHPQPASLEELTGLTGLVPEVEALSELARQSGSWWQRLSRLAAGTQAPPRPKKSLPDARIIAISDAPEADQAEAILTDALKAMKTFLAHLKEHHAEW